MPLPTVDISLYRPCAAMAVFNLQGQVWLGKRIGGKGDYTWQMPQGGIDPGESPEHCAIRELEEETGMSVQHLSPLGEISDWLYYDIPKGKGKRGGHNWRGQRQKWFAFRYHGTDSQINLQHHLPAEFSEFRWGHLSEAVNLIVPFKRKVYAHMAIEFECFATAPK